MHPPYLVSLPDVEVSAAAWPCAGASISVAHILREAIRELLLGFHRIALAALPHHRVASPMMPVQLCRFDDEDEVDFRDMMNGEEIADLLRYSHGVAAAVGVCDVAK
ncbi:fungal tRNA ligase adenylyltransferase [Apiospora arundinis]